MIRPLPYLLVFLTAVFLIGGSVFYHNWQIDPYRFKAQPDTLADRLYKPDYERYTRTLKPLQFVLNPSKRIFLGTSRMEYLGPDQTVFQKELNPGFNLALSSGSTYEMNQLARYAHRHHPVEGVWYGLDFYSFTNLSEEKDSLLNKDLLSGKQFAWIEIIKNYTSFQGIEDAKNCVQYNTTRGDSLGLDVQNQYNNRGSRTGNWREMTFELRGKSWLKWCIGNSMKQYQELYDRDTLQFSVANFAWYRKLVEEQEERSSEFYPFVNPLFSGHFTMLLQSDGYDDYKVWLDSLAHSGGVYYFGGVNQYTSDSTLYWDSHHARKEMFVYMHSRMLKKESELGPDLFGYWVDEKNIKQLLQELDKQKAYYDQ